jgi:hypothetical protein
MQKQAYPEFIGENLQDRPYASRLPRADPYIPKDWPPAHQPVGGLSWATLPLWIDRPPYQLQT